MLLAVELIGAAVSLNICGHGMYVDAFCKTLLVPRPPCIDFMALYMEVCCHIEAVRTPCQSMGDKAVEQMLNLKQLSFCFCSLTAFFCGLGQVTSQLKRHHHAYMSLIFS